MIYSLQALGAPNFTPFSTADPLLGGPIVMATSQMQMASAPNPPTPVQSSVFTAPAVTVDDRSSMNSPVNAPIHSGYVGRRRGRDIPPYTGSESLNNSRDYDPSIHGNTSTTSRTAGCDIRLDFDTLDSESQSAFTRARKESTNSNRSSVVTKQKRKRCSLNSSLRSTSKSHTPIKDAKKPKKHLPTPLRDRMRYPGLSSDWSSPEFDGPESKKLKTDDGQAEKKTKLKKKRNKTSLLVQIPLNLITAKTEINMNGDSGFHSNARDVSSESREASLKEHSNHHGNDSPATPESASVIKTLPPLEARKDDKTIDNSAILALNSVPLFTQDNGDQNNDDSDITHIEDTQEGLLSLLPSWSRSASPTIPLQGTIANPPHHSTTGEQSQTPIIVENIVSHADKHENYTNVETSIEVCESYLEDGQKSCDTTMEVQSMFQDRSVFDYSSDLSVCTDIGSVSRKKSRWKKRFLQRMTKGKKCRSSDDVPSSSKVGNTPSTEGKSLSGLRQYRLSHFKSPKFAKNVKKRVRPIIPPRKSQTVISEIPKKMESNNGDNEMVIDESLPEQMDAKQTNNDLEVESESPLPCNVNHIHVDETQQPERELNPTNTSHHSNQNLIPAKSQSETTLNIDSVHTVEPADEKSTTKPSPLTTLDNSPSGSGDSTDSDSENEAVQEPADEKSTNTKPSPLALKTHDNSHSENDDSTDSEPENEAVQEPADKRPTTTKPSPLKTHDNSYLGSDDSTDSEPENKAVQEPADKKSPTPKPSPLKTHDNSHSGNDDSYSTDSEPENEVVQEPADKKYPTPKPSPLTTHDNSQLANDDSDSTDSEPENEVVQEPADGDLEKPAVESSPLLQETVEDDSTNSDTDTEAQEKTQIDNNSKYLPKSALTLEKKESKLSLKLKRPSRKSSDSSSDTTDTEVDTTQRTHRNAIAKTASSPVDSSDSFSEEEDSDTSNAPRYMSKRNTNSV